MSDAESVDDALADALRSPSQEGEDDPNAEADAARASASEEEEADDAAGQEGTGSTAQEAPAQGGGAQGAAVSSSTNRYRSFAVQQQQGSSRISRVTFYYDQGPTVEKKRPASDSAELPLWQLMEAQHRQVKKLKADSKTLAKLEEVLYRSKTVKEPAPAPAPAPNGDVFTTTANGSPYTYQVSELPLREAARAEIERRYFLKIEEETHAPDGRPYAPYGKSGSMCGAFPHMITLVARAKGPNPAKQYCLGQNHRIGLRIQLMERVTGGGDPIKASEFELLRYVNNQYNQAQLQRFGHFEKTLTLYVTLEHDRSGDTVLPKSFKSKPQGDSLFSPPESPPYHAGSTERVMEGGVVHFKKLWLNKRVTTSNLDEEVSTEPKFRLAVRTLNPILHELAGFTTRSLPFVIKSVLHNDVNKKQKFVRNPDGQVVPFAG